VASDDGSTYRMLSEMGLDCFGALETRHMLSKEVSERSRDPTRRDGTGSIEGWRESSQGL
jgi:hypothetical protein